MKQRTRVFTEVELVEVSAVAIPANRQSLVRAASAFRSASPAGSAGGHPGEPADLDPLSKAIAPVVERVLQQHLDTGPGGHLCTLVQDVVESVLGHAGLGVGDPYDLHSADTPEPAESSLGDSELRNALRGALASAGGDPHAN